MGGLVAALVVVLVIVVVAYATIKYQQSKTTGYLEAYSTVAQPLPDSTGLTVQFDKLVTNTIPNLTVSGQGNTTYTNAGKTPMYLVISGMVPIWPVASGSVGTYAVWLNRSSNTRLYFQTRSNCTAIPGGNPMCGGIMGGPLILNPQESFTIGATTWGGNTLATTTTIAGYVGGANGGNGANQTCMLTIYRLA